MKDLKSGAEMQKDKNIEQKKPKNSTNKSNKHKVDSKNKSKKVRGAEKSQKIVEIEPQKISILPPDTTLNNIKSSTTLEGKGLSVSGKGQIRNLEVEDMCNVDESWLPKILNLEGAGEKYKNIGENELKFILNIIKTNNNIISYKQSFNCTNETEDYIMQRASDLKRRSDVAELLAILRERMVRKTERQLQWQFSESVENLKFLIDTAKEEVSNAREDGKRSYLTLTRVTAIKDAVKELNQMMGYTEKSVQIANNVTIVGNEADLPD